jgi:hypothetical protein
LHLPAQCAGPCLSRACLAALTAGVAPSTQEGWARQEARPALAPGRSAAMSPLARSPPLRRALAALRGLSTQAGGAMQDLGLSEQQLEFREMATSFAAAH